MQKARALAMHGQTSCQHFDADMPQTSVMNSLAVAFINHMSCIADLPSQACTADSGDMMSTAAAARHR